MAIVGGAGNPVGGSFTGPAEALEIIGDHAYAYSGLHAASTTPANHLDFTSGNYYFVGRLYLNGAVAPGSTNGQDSTCELSFNGVSVALIRTRCDADDQPSTQSNDIIIPPYTDVTANVDSAAGGVQTTSLVLTGRIYRTRD